MTKKEIIEKYKSGFCVYGNDPILTEEWLLDKENTIATELRFIGYDANLWPMPDWREFDKNNPWHVKRLKKCKQVAKDFEGKVYMDFICITDILEVAYDQ